MSSPFGHLVRVYTVRVVTAVQKTVSASGAVPGDELVRGMNGQAVTYSFVVANPGAVALTNV